MPHRNLSLAEAVGIYVGEVDRPFRIEEACSWVRSWFRRKRPAAANLVASVLRERQLTFYDGEFDHYIPRRVYFAGARFRVVPLASEIEAGVLFPGHRLMPFCRRDVFPADCVVETGGGVDVPRRQALWRVSEVIPFHSLFGWQNMLNYFVAEDEANAAALAKVEQDEDAAIRLTALDFSQFYRDSNFQEGDSLVFTVLDWDQGRYRMEHLRAEKAAVDRAALEKQWRRTLEDSLEEVFEESGVLVDAYEQLSLAFFYGGKFLNENPALHIGGFLAKSQRIQLCQVGSQAVLWRVGESPSSSAFPNLDLTRRPPAGVIGSLDAMLQDLGVSLRRSDIEAYMRDEVFRGGSSLAAALQRCLRWRGELNFFDDRQRFSFSREIELLWVGVLASAPQSQDPAVGRQRRRALRIMDSKLEWLRNLNAKGVSADELPTADFVALSHLMSSLSALLEGLNAPDAAELADEKELAQTLEEIEHSSRRLMDSVENRIELARIASELE